MPSIPSLNWREQKQTPTEQTDQLVGCMYCPLDEVPPATIYLYKGTAICAAHRGSPDHRAGGFPIPAAHDEEDLQVRLEEISKGYENV